MEQKALSSKVALVTGAAQGIGLATTKILLSNGAKVCMVDMDKLGREVCTDLQKKFSPDSVQFLQVDVTDEDQLNTAFLNTKKNFGGLDIVCNIAGVSYLKDWKKAIDINMVAVMSGTFLGIKHMSTRKGGNGGTVINMSSLAGLVGAPTNPVYAASKYGVVGFSRSMFLHAKRDSVKVKCVCPSFVRTRMMNDHQRTDGLDKLIKNLGVLEPEDVAEVVLELVTDSSSSGVVVSLTGHGEKYLDLITAKDFFPPNNSKL